MATSDTTRDRVLAAAAELLVREGREGLSTRAVSAAAGIQPPTLYRLFGDKQGLLAAVAAYGFERFLESKQTNAPSDDPVEDLRRGWDHHCGFGLTQPEFYVLMYTDARPGEASPARSEGMEILRRKVTRVADAGRLRMSVERAMRLIHSTGMGVVLSLIATPPQERDQELSAIVRENVLSLIVSAEAPSPDTGPAARAVALRASLDEAKVLSDAERVLMAEWLDRIADAPDA
ncbi:TetR/AcrR family transcriptional regulator [Amycolatopsis saalfeldensis]|uniref:DNA-binding transcriptional regulator, AcrR family n=1 Tax=Amycolatopsis saalfeldensis TaxID=394193 RepID=A0A1H8T7K4_9PSEU|nr:TetR/AcrR family transcriptional regulator [Amycolatopsis saalfeldensis]SEO86488.1 DNA-binding transcriptional regulator, AcrR family [Amycolatopsis saalfeldensis]